MWGHCKGVFVWGHSMNNMRSVYASLVLGVLIGNSCVASANPCCSCEQESAVTVVASSRSVSVMNSAAQIVQMLVRCGVSISGIVAIADAFANQTGKTQFMQAGLGILAVLAALFVRTPWDGENYPTSVVEHTYCTQVDPYANCHDYCPACYHHDVVSAPVIVQHDTITEPIIIHSTTVQATIEPETAGETQVVQEPADTQAASQDFVTTESSANTENVELNNFWNDPFNY
jgi:hypothetical protein